MGERTHWTVEA